MSVGSSGELNGLSWCRACPLLPTSGKLCFHFKKTKTKNGFLQSRDKSTDPERTGCLSVTASGGTLYKPWE